jgi:hypothetical protein
MGCRRRLDRDVRQVRNESRASIAAVVSASPSTLGAGSSTVLLPALRPFRSEAQPAPNSHGGRHS